MRGSDKLAFHPGTSPPSTNSSGQSNLKALTNNRLERDHAGRAHYRCQSRGVFFAAARLSCSKLLELNTQRRKEGAGLAVCDDERRSIQNLLERWLFNVRASIAGTGEPIEGMHE